MSVSRWIGALWTTPGLVHSVLASVARAAAARNCVSMPFFFADSHDLYKLADRIARHAASLRSAATSLANAVLALHWSGMASEVFFTESRSVGADMLACARRLDDAADALRRHAAHVQAGFDEIRTVLQNTENLATSAAHEVSDFLLGGHHSDRMVGVIN